MIRLAGLFMVMFLIVPAFVTAQPLTPILTFAHEDAVWGATWSADNSRVMSWGRDKTIRVWDAATGEELLHLVHPEEVDRVLWSTDEAMILARSFSGMFKVWDATTGEEAFTIKPTGSTLGGVSWYADETQILTWTDATVQFWDRATGTLLKELVSDTPIAEIAWNDPQPDHQTELITSHSGGAFKLWDVETASLIHDLDFPTEFSRFGANSYYPPDASWSEDGMHLVTLTNFDEGLSPLALWEREAGQLVFRMSSQQSACDEPQALAAEFNRAGTLLLMGGTGLLQVCDLDTLEPLWQVTNEIAPILQLKWNQDESLVMGQTYSTIEVRDTLSGELQVALQSDTGIRWAHWNPDESRIALLPDADVEVRVYDASSGDLLATLPHNDVALDAQWSADGQRLLTWGWDGNVNIWQIE